MSTLFNILHRWFAPLGADLPPIYLVGGAVRDYLLNRDPKDIDLMTAEPQALARRLALIHDAAVVPFVNKADTPCFRVVRRSNIDDFIDLVPIHGGSVPADLELRDFTINAMVLALKPGGVLADEPIDPLNGQKDLRRRLVRAAGPHAFAQDPLRIIRAVRFAAELDFGITADTLKAIQAAVDQLSGVAGERITRELFLILDQPHSTPHIRCLDQLGALRAIFPEIAPMHGCLQNQYHHLDVWGHSLAALENAENLLQALEAHFGQATEKVRQNLNQDHRLALLKLALLLHDVGKPATRSVHPTTGQVLFHGHDQLSATMIAVIAQRLKLSSRDQDYLIDLVRNHMDLRTLSNPEVLPHTLMRWFRRLGANMVPLILLSMADVLSTRGPAATEALREHHLAWCRATVVSYFKSIDTRLSVKPLIDGHDLIALGIEPGPELGRILRAIQEAQDNQTITSRDEAIELAERLRP